jgi:hypothetical protein
VPGYTQQEWQLLRHPISTFAPKGKGDTAKIAANICAIVTGKGARVN